MAETKAKSIYAKIQQSRVDVLGSIKKDSEGYGYDYFSNDDILPVANEVLNRNGLCPVFRIEKRFFVKSSTVTSDPTKGTDVEKEEKEFEFWGVLDIYDIDSKEHVTYEIPTCLASIKGATGVQNYGAMQTFTKRYLYISFLEVADVQNNGQGNAKDTDVEKSADSEKVTGLATKNQVKLINEKAGKDLKEVLKFYNVKNVEDMTLQQASECLERLS